MDTYSTCDAHVVQMVRQDNYSVLYCVCSSASSLTRGVMMRLLAQPDVDGAPRRIRSGAVRVRRFTGAAGVSRPGVRGPVWEGRPAAWARCRA